MVSDLKTLIGTRIRIAREVAGMSREQLAALISRTPEALGNIERGASLAPLDTLGLIGGALSIPLSDLVGEEPQAKSRRVEIETRAIALIRTLNNSELELALEIIEVLKRRATNAR
ncbi:helix-turn-helix domain-containing protein [Microvirga flavescens]|uniref:helix-turn-helix domain-containing protein n=1 Tax=Microvirga flavescens TaxID=2249811 RepID=UPI000DD716B6